MRAAPSPNGFLVLYVWIESGHPDPVRVRVTAVPSPDRMDESVEVAATTSVGRAAECVREWLDRFVATTLTGEDGGPGQDIT